MRKPSGISSPSSPTTTASPRCVTCTAVTTSGRTGGREEPESTIVNYDYPERPCPTVILTVTPDPAWDLTYEVPNLVPGEVHRVARVRRRLGGKGMNVARLLPVVGHNAVAIIPGPPGLAAEAAWTYPPGTPPPSARGSSATSPRAARHQADTRRPGRRRHHDLVLGTGHRAGSRHRPGPDRPCTCVAPPGRPRWAGGGRARCRGGSRAAGARGIVVSGSLPPGFDARFHARLAVMALEAGVPAVIDTSGEALKHAASAPGAVLAPNAAELAQLTGSPATVRRRRSTPLGPCWVGLCWLW